MDFKVIFSSGGRFNKKPDQKMTDDETGDGAKLIVDALIKNGHEAQICKITPSKIDTVKKIQADAIFNLVEWSGRDYPLGVSVLKTLEKRGIPYTGADSKSYEWSCDKISMKKMFEKFNIPTPRWATANPKDNLLSISKKIESLNFPIIAKPAYEHCAIGINKKSVIHSKRGAAEKIFVLLEKYKEPVLIEEFINGREFTTTVVKNHSLHVFPPAEVIFKTGGIEKFLSFKTKWIDCDSAYTSRVVTNPTLSKNLKKISRKIFTQMDCKGYIRIDIRIRKGKIYVLEVNINPSIWPEDCYGLTISTEAAGWSFNKLVNEIATAAITNQIKN